MDAEVDPVVRMDPEVEMVVEVDPETEAVEDPAGGQTMEGIGKSAWRAIYLK